MEAIPEAQGAYERALALDPSLAAAYAGIARIEWRFGWNCGAAEEAFRRSLDIDPGDAATHGEFGRFLRSVGNARDAERHLEAAVELDPLGVHRADLWLVRRDLDDARGAEEAARRMIADHPHHAATGRIRAFQAWERGDRLQAADSLAARAVAADSVGGSAIDAGIDAGIDAALAAMLYAAAGTNDRANVLLGAASASPHRDPVLLARALALAGDTAAALGWLDRGVIERHPGMVWLDLARQIGADRYAPPLLDLPAFDLASADFERIAERVGFPDAPGYPTTPDP